ncbi:MAG: M28 family peptidase [Actinomycetota bacterium]|nr:M28 family peptidase [Actinomycetota bacterium]
MTEDAAEDSAPPPLPSEEALREVVFTLAAMHRPPCSPGEREAAEWLAERLRAARVNDVALEDEPSWGPFPPLVASLGFAAAAGGVLAAGGRRWVGPTLSMFAALGLADEIQNGPRVFRRALRPEQRTVNVVARAGEPQAARTLVLLAHHDAAQTGFIFDQTAIRNFHERFPTVIPKIKTQPPQWWGGFFSTALTVLSGLTGRRGPAKVGAAIGLVGAAVIADIWRSETVPGANDNLTACAVLVALAEMLRERPLTGLRVWLVSAGAEETFQDGIRGFMARHSSELDPASTSFLCLDTIGSPRLMMLEGEGPMWMEDYDATLRDKVAHVAERDGLALERGFRARASTDAIIPTRHGYPTANLSSVNEYHNLSNYHLPTDTAENVDYTTVAEAAKVAYALAAELADETSPRE